MNDKIKIAIMGYGNLGAGIEKALVHAPDMELRAIFTRRDPADITLLTKGVPVLAADAALDMQGGIDVMLLCGGSAKDLPEQAPRFAKIFNIVDSFDAHSDIPKYYQSIEQSAVNTTAIISTGWDPGLFSLMRVLFGAVLPMGSLHTFWGAGVSQGHTNAIRTIDGVLDAVQYTIPKKDAIEAARSGTDTQFTARDKHLRECYVVAKDGADLGKIEQEIKNMHHYFAEYDTTVEFIGKQELLEKHSGFPHGGHVLKSGATGENNLQNMEFSLKLDDNPEFTSSVMIAYARAAYRLAREGNFGVKTVFDIPFAYLSPIGRETLIKEML